MSEGNVREAEGCAEHVTSSRRECLLEITEPNWETMRTGVNSMFRFAVLNIANADAFARGLQGLDSTEIKSEACTCLFWQVIIAVMRRTWRYVTDATRFSRRRAKGTPRGLYSQP